MNRFEKNILVGSRAGYNITTGDYNILLGDRAGENLTDASHQFIFRVDNSAFSTKMTPAEYQVVAAVIQRAIKETTA